MDIAILFLMVIGLMLVGVPIAVSLGLSSILFLIAYSDASLASVAQTFYQAMEGHSTLLAIPFFILASTFMSTGGVAKRIIRFAIACVGHLPGGLAIAGVMACMMFAALSGSSPATVVAIGSIVIAAMRQVGYSKDFAAGVICNAGTLGILIPPSIVLVIYAILAEQNIAKLFLAAFVPGIMAAIGYVIVIALYARWRPQEMGTVPPMPMAERWKATAKVWPVLLIFIAVVGGIYLGFFTPTEGAAVGAFGTGVAAWLSGGLNRKTLVGAVMGTAVSTGMIFMIVLGAGVYNTFLALSQLPQEAAAMVSGWGVSPLLVLIAILVLYVILGCFMDSLSMILLTIPVFFPIVTALDFGLPPEEFAIWFGILVLIVVEVGLITPPVGMNLFVINSMARDTPITQTYRAILPFVTSDFIRTAILVAFPSITLFVLRL